MWRERDDGPWASLAPREGARGGAAPKQVSSNATFPPVTSREGPLTIVLRSCRATKDESRLIASTRPQTFNLFLDLCLYH